MCIQLTEGRWLEVFHVLSKAIYFFFACDESFFSGQARFVGAKYYRNRFSARRATSACWGDAILRLSLGRKKVAASGGLQ